MKLIDKDELLRTLEQDIDVTVTGVENMEAVRRCLQEVLDDVRNSPVVDAVPVKHGKWIIRDNPGTGWYRVTCSECGEDVTSTAPCIGFFPNAKVTWNYCPNCGARMDEDETD